MKFKWILNFHCKLSIMFTVFIDILSLEILLKQKYLSQRGKSTYQHQTTKTNPDSHTKFSQTDGFVNGCPTDDPGKSACVRILSHVTITCLVNTTRAKALVRLHKPLPAKKNKCLEQKLQYLLELNSNLYPSLTNSPDFRNYSEKSIINISKRYTMF